MAAALALLLGFSLVASLAAPAVSASETSVRNLVIRSITVDPKTKVATVRGAVTCTGGESVEVFVDVSQTVGRLHTVSAFGDKELDCDGRVRFSLRLRNEEGRLGPGDADVDANEGALLQPPPHLFDPPLQVRPVRQGLRQLHAHSPPSQIVAAKRGPFHTY